MAASHQVKKSRRHVGCVLRTHHPFSAFTLVELVVVIGVIIVLAALTLAVSRAVVGGSEVRQTQSTLRLLETALGEWEATADRKISWGDGPEYDMQEVETTAIFMITELLNTTARSSPVREIIAQIDPDFVHTYRKDKYPPWINTTTLKDKMNTKWAVGHVPLPNDSRASLGLAVIDAWEQPFWVVHPGRVADPNKNVIDPDGTMRTVSELAGGAVRNRQLLFISPGPDGKIGDLSQPEESELFKQAADNVYSYVPELDVQ